MGGTPGTAAVPTVRGAVDDDHIPFADHLADLPTLVTEHLPRDSQFFQAGSIGRAAGGLFSLDGVHPTTIGVGVVAHEMLKICTTSLVRSAARTRTSMGRAHGRCHCPTSTGVLSSDNLVSRPDA
jgi:hypothetical protein